MLGNEKEQFQNFEILMEDITFDNGVFASNFECFTVVKILPKGLQVNSGAKKN